MTRLLADPGGDGNPGPTYSAQGGLGGSPIALFTPSAEKAEENQILGLDAPGQDDAGVAIIWLPTAVPYTLLVPEALGSDSGWWVWDDGENLNVANGDNSIAYSGPSPALDEIHLLILTLDEVNGASSIRLDGEDLVAPDFLWPTEEESFWGSLLVSNVDMEAPGSEVGVLWAAYWNGAVPPEGPGPD